MLASHAGRAAGAALAPPASLARKGVTWLGLGLGVGVGLGIGFRLGLGLG